MYNLITKGGKEMKKLLTLSIALSTLVFGFDAEVKKADVKVEINGKLQEFKKGDKFTLKSGDIICFKDGKGSVKIVGEDYKKSLNKHIKVCKVMPGKDSEPPKMSLNSILSPLKKAQEKQVSGVSRKSSEVTTVTKDIELNKNKEYILIDSNTWGLPVTLKVYDTKGKVVLEDKNKDNSYTAFAIKTNMLKSGYKIVVTDGFNEKVFEGKIK